MRFDVDGGLWSSGPEVTGPPVLAVLEVAGAVLAWTVDDPAGADAARITITDVTAAHWLWRVVGSDGHAAVAAALDGRIVSGSVDVPGAEPAVDALNPLRRIAIGHWARRWWPASLRDGIAGLDGALLDAELAVALVAAEDYLDEDAVDAEVRELLAGHRGALAAHREAGDPRVVALVDACRELAEDAGVWDATLPALDVASARRADYALAAGAGGGGGIPAAVADGTGSLNWDAVPPGVFDAADHTVSWRVDAGDDGVAATVRVAVAGGLSASGIEVRLDAGGITGRGALDADGVARVELVGDGAPLTGDSAWNHDWTSTSVDVGADVPAAPAAAELRSRARDYARARLGRPGPDAFLAEILAAEADY